MIYLIANLISDFFLFKYLLCVLFACVFIKLKLKETRPLFLDEGFEGEILRNEFNFLS